MAWERGRPARTASLARGVNLVRIRIYGIIGFSGFSPARVFYRKALVRISDWRDFRLWRKARVGRNEILKIPPIL